MTPFAHTATIALTPQGAQGPAVPGRSARVPRPARRLGVVIPPLVNLFLPLAIFYGLTALRVGVVPASLAGGVPPAASALYGLVRRRRIDRLAMFTLIQLAVRGALSALVIVGLVHLSPQVVLASRGNDVLPGVLMLLSTLRGRPLVLELERPFVELRAGAGAADALEAKWERDAGFRHGMRLLTAVWGAGFIAGSGLRVLLAFVLPAHVVPLAQEIQFLLLLCLLGGFQVSYLKLKGLWIKAPEAQS